MADIKLPPWNYAIAHKLEKLGKPVVTGLLWGTIIVSLLIALAGSFWLRALWTAFLLSP